MLRLIVGIEIEITRLVGKFKLSQNKEARDIRAPAQRCWRAANRRSARPWTIAPPGATAEVQASPGCGRWWTNSTTVPSGSSALKQAPVGARAGPKMICAPAASNRR